MRSLSGNFRYLFWGDSCVCNDPCGLYSKVLIFQIYSLLWFIKVLPSRKVLPSDNILYAEQWPWWTKSGYKCQVNTYSNFQSEVMILIVNPSLNPYWFIIIHAVWIVIFIRYRSQIIIHYYNDMIGQRKDRISGKKVTKVISEMNQR